MAASTVLILIDALGHELASMHNFEPAGLTTRVRLRTVLGFSQAALTTILTGVPPNEHGLWMMYSFAADDSPFRFLKAAGSLASTEKLWMRRLLRHYIDRRLKVTAYYNLYSVPAEVLCRVDLPARRQLFSPGGGGEAETVIDKALKKGMPVFIRHYDTEEESSFADLEEELKKGVEGLFILYTAGLDSVMHGHGTASERTKDRLAWYAKKIERILSLREDFRIIVMGGHGMCDVTETVDLQGMVAQLELKIPGDCIPFYDSTMARFKIINRKAEDKLAMLLSGCSFGRLLGRDEKAELGIYFPGGKFGDLIFLMNRGSIILPSFMGAERLASMHGYHPDEPCMYSTLFTNIKFHEANADIRDVAGIITHILDRSEG